MHLRAVEQLRASPALGLCWFLWRRARWGFLAIAAYFLLSFVLMTFFSGQKADDDAVMLMIPTLAAFIFVFTIFGYGDGDFGARESGFPRHAMTLPAPTWALVLWPMLFGAAAVALLWLMLSLIILRPGGVPAPVVWPAIMLAAMLASMQAAIVWPYGVRYVRLPVLLAIGVGVVASAVCAKEYNIPPILLGTGFMGAGVGAYLAALTGLRRARRGDGTRWRWLEKLLARFEGRLRQRTAFESAQYAQRWIERTRNAFVLPAQVTLICALLWIPALGFKPKHPGAPFLLGDKLIELNGFAVISCVALILPIMMAAFMGNLLGKRDTWTKELTVGSFLGVRPISTTDIVSCKLWTAWWVTAFCWLVVLLSIAGWAIVLRELSAPILSTIFGDPVSMTRIFLAILVLSLLIALTWKLQAVSIWISLYGRRWLTIAVPIAVLLSWMIVSPAIHWLYRHPSHRVAVQNWLSEWLVWILAALVLLKGALSLWIIRRLIERKLADATRVMTWVEVWVAITGILCVPVCWLLPWQGAKVLPLLLGCMLVVPFTRLVLAPLMLHLNRHR